MHTYVSYVPTALAWMQLREGDWDEAERITHGEIERGITVVQLLAKTVLAELAVRRGDQDAGDRVADLAEHADRAAEPQRIMPAIELMVERALTEGEPMPVDWFERWPIIRGERGTRRPLRIRLAGWAAVAGLDLDVDDASPAVRRDAPARLGGGGGAFGESAGVRPGADAVAARGRAGAGRGARDRARLGAEPLTRRVASRMRDLGQRVPRGPRRTTRANPAGLTARQLEVLALLVEGLTNAEIADRLVVSPRTAEHHVAAVLAKLGAATRARRRPPSGRAPAARARLRLAGNRRRGVGPPLWSAGPARAMVWA